MPDVTNLAARLQAPFAADEIEWRVQSSGKTARGPWVKVIAYVTNRAIMTRLDQVVGPEAWRNEYTPTPAGYLCGLSLLVNSHQGFQWITKWDGADATDVEPTKGALSGAMKRAAVQWGIGRYLHDLPEGFAKIAADDDRDAEYLKANDAKHGAALRWRPPTLPAWALPAAAITVTAPPKPSAKPSAEQANTQAIANILDIKLPGANTSLHGHGGKYIRDLSANEIEVVLQDFDTMVDGVRNRYKLAIEALGERLADLRGSI